MSTEYFWEMEDATAPAAPRSPETRRRAPANFHFVGISDPNPSESCRLVARLEDTHINFHLFFQLTLTVHLIILVQHVTSSIQCLPIPSPDKTRAAQTQNRQPLTAKEPRLAANQPQNPSSSIATQPSSAARPLPRGDDEPPVRPHRRVTEGSFGSVHRRIPRVPRHRVFGSTTDRDYVILQSEPVDDGSLLCTVTPSFRSGPPSSKGRAGAGRA